MTAGTVYARFRDTTSEYGQAPFLEVLEETARIYGIAAETVSYAAMLERVEAWRGQFRATG